MGPSQAPPKKHDGDPKKQPPQKGTKSNAPKPKPAAEKDAGALHTKNGGKKKSEAEHAVEGEGAVHNKNGGKKKSEAENAVEGEGAVHKKKGGKKKNEAGNAVEGEGAV